MKRHWTQDYDRVAQVIRAWDQISKEPVIDGERSCLHRVAKSVGLSPSQFHRIFHRFAGVTPKTFFQVLTSQHLKLALEQGKTVLDASFSAGLSSPGRAHDLMLKTEQMTPGEYRRRGEGQMLRFGVAATPFGDGFFGWNDRGLLKLSFIEPTKQETVMNEFKKRWSRARLIIDEAGAKQWSHRVFDQWGHARDQPITLVLSGTRFQIQVWRALLDLPPGTLLNYGSLADYLGRPGASRAVGTAVGANEIAWLIPCHRVLRESGAWGGYRWGLDRKKCILAIEQAQLQAESTFTRG
jgi:AraC family transcriptional regulator of adaptative response/methylated-DNA-[protein]-cysteine methyltransferase